MIAKIRDFVKANINEIILFAIIALLLLLSFAFGYITAKYQAKEPIQIQNATNT